MGWVHFIRDTWRHIILAHSSLSTTAAMPQQRKRGHSQPPVGPCCLRLAGAPAPPGGRKNPACNTNSKQSARAFGEDGAPAEAVREAVARHGAQELDAFIGLLSAAVDVAGVPREEAVICGAHRVALAAKLACCSAKHARGSKEKGARLVGTTVLCAACRLAPNPSVSATPPPRVRDKRGLALK
jgi:hypothetical protein